MNVDRSAVFSSVMTLGDVVDVLAECDLAAGWLL